MKNVGYPIIIILATESDLLEINHLGYTYNLCDAKNIAKQKGYSVIDVNEGGLCETSEAWNGEMSHLITVSLQ